MVVVRIGVLKLAVSVVVVAIVEVVGVGEMLAVGAVETAEVLADSCVLVVVVSDLVGAVEYTHTPES